MPESSGSGVRGHSSPRMGEVRAAEWGVLPSSPCILTRIFLHQEGRSGAAGGQRPQPRSEISGTNPPQRPIAEIRKGAERTHDRNWRSPKSADRTHGRSWRPAITEIHGTNPRPELATTEIHGTNHDHPDSNRESAR